MINNYNTAQFFFVLRKYKDTMKYLKLVGSDLEFRKNAYFWTYKFQKISMQQLRTLHCEYINYNRESLVTLLNTCCNTIQEVKLKRNTKIHILDVAALQSLETLPELRMLTIKPARFVNTSSMLALLKRVPALENLFS